MKKGFLILIIVLPLILTGCWDMAEINQRIFISSIGADLNKNEGMDKYLISYVYPNINAIGKNATEDKKKFTVQSNSSSLFQAGREASTREEFPFYYKHLKVFVMGEELAEDSKLVRQVVDELNRDTKINKKLQILITEGEARDILDSKPADIPIADGTIYNILKDNKSAARFTPQTLTGIIKELDCNNVTLVPKIDKMGNRITIAGAGIIKDYKLIGYLNEIENRAIALIKNKVKLELIDLEYKDGLLSYNITGSKSCKDVNIGEEISVNIKVCMEGYLQGYIIGKDINVFDNDVLIGMEKAIEKKIKKEVENVIDKSQKVYNADLIGVGEYLSKHYPKEWENIKDNWDQIYPDVKFNIVVDTQIRRIGLTK